MKMRKIEDSNQKLFNQMMKSEVWWSSFLLGYVDKNNEFNETIKDYF